MATYGEILITTKDDQAGSRQIRRRAQAGELRQIVERVYTSNLKDGLEAVVGRNIWYILPHLFPKTVVTSRTGAKMRPYQPEKGGKSYVFLTGPYSNRTVELPGMEIRLIEGPSALPGDSPMITAEFYSPSRPRSLLENLKPTRTRGGVQRNLSDAEFEDYLVTLLGSGGPDNFNKMRDEARKLAPQLSAEEEFKKLDRLMGGLLGTQKVRFASKAAEIRRAGADKNCCARLQELFAHLKSLSFPDRPVSQDQGVRQSNAFLEAYFSNFIEGTEFTVVEAKRIVFEGVAPINRPADGHDVIATYRLLTDERALTAVPADYQEFENMLRARHALLMDARPEKQPGRFKTVNNKVSGISMVQPDLVVGTLKYGYDLLQGLTEPFARGVFLHCLIAEVHPFDDGNGRISRLHLTSELLRGNQAQVIIPTVFRGDYIGGMRALTKRSEPGPITRACLRAQEVVSTIHEATVDGAIEAWARTNAFVREGQNARWENYDAATEIEWRDEVPATKDYWNAEDNPQGFLSPNAMGR
ncbi:Fic family protein [Bradyrhizobium sp. CCGUVB4N]|uniref:Fic family protein n=1 Tax=Bradyrhizobium sp. CCGUVB4N TaxID=2949631 RepID=UPI0020B31B19|nr:Fic family protein [Bradyrhizobium sp. CCGUVB4N]MCP3380441.1 Fic family protein [Bradyrhizobium sp. CCGUVB4N]